MALPRLFINWMLLYEVWHRFPHTVLLYTHIQLALHWNTLCQLVNSFPSKVFLVKCYWLSVCLTWHWIWKWYYVPACQCLFISRHWLNILNSLFISFLLQRIQFVSLTQTDCTNFTFNRYSFILVQSYFTWCASSGVPRKFVCRDSTNSVEDGGQRECGFGGSSPLVRGSGGNCNLVQEISFQIVKLS